MERKTVLNILSKMMLVEAVLLLVPSAVSLFYGEKSCALQFLITAAITAAAFLPVLLATKTETHRMFAKEAFILVPLCWILWSLIGALPFLLTGTLTNYVDCLFEAVSGFTTTGATVFEDVESLPHGILLWRSLMHWVGGMGVLVFALAIIPMTKTGNYMNLFRAEMTGSDVGKLVPKAKHTAFILYGIYAVLTAVLAVLLVLGGMPVFDSINHAMSTAGTGGMSVKNASIAAYDSPYIDAVITVFMFLMGVNFTMYFLALKGKIKDIFKSAELKFYIIEFVAVSLVIAVQLFFTENGYSFMHSLRLSAFQTASLMSSTGYATADFNLWQPFAKTLLIICMFIGACAGSTGGGIKVSRIQIATKTVYRDVKRQISPRFVYMVKSEGKAVDNYTINSVMTFIVCYFTITIGSTLLFAIDGLNFEQGFTSAVSALSNMGPFFDRFGQTQNYMFMPILSKLVMSADMLLGRLEIFPFLILFSKSSINRKYI